MLATVGARAGSQGFAIDPHQRDGRDPGRHGVTTGEPVLADPPALRAKMRAPEVRDRGRRCAAGDGQRDRVGLRPLLRLRQAQRRLHVADRRRRPTAALAKDDRLTNYSPTFKRTLLVEALAYISRFAGTRCVIKFGGAAMAKPALAQAFCDDIKLLRSVGLQPIVVHGGGPEITRALEKLGSAAGVRRRACA